MLKSIANIILFHVGWFGCILGAAHGMPWLGPIVVIAMVAAHVPLIGMSRRLLALYALLFVSGWIADSVVVLLGAMSFESHARLGPLAPLWMAAMWVNFGTTLFLSMGWMRRRLVIGSVFGLIGGPLAYVTGDRLGAVVVEAPLWRSILIIGLEWAIAMPVLLRLATVLCAEDVEGGS